METVQRRRQLDPRLVPSRGSAADGEREARRSAADAVADAADRAMLEALESTDAVMRSMQQQTGQ
jgi:hypothetical protein